MKYFLSCDWGTSALRIRLAEAGTGMILAEIQSKQGIAETYRLWQQSNENSNEKIPLFLGVLKSHIAQSAEKAGVPIRNSRLIISGMASASIGMIELPYASVPLPVDGSGLNTLIIRETTEFPHTICVIPGLRCRTDVMRGEETQLIGCINPSAFVKNEVFIFPGTHSKHIVVQNNQITNFTTYMTGEFFALLSQKSILAGNVYAGGEDGNAEVVPESFFGGLAESTKSSLLHSAFTTRVNHLSGVYNKAEGFYYLSGLVIGNEINELKHTSAGIINLVCDLKLWNLYKLALEKLLPGRNLNIYPPNFTGQATVNGQIKISSQLNFLS